MNTAKQSRRLDAFPRTRKQPPVTKKPKSPAVTNASVRRTSLQRNNRSLAVKLQETQRQLNIYRRLFEESREFVTQTKLVKSQMVQLSATFKDVVKTFDENLLLLEFDDSNWANIKTSAQSRKSIRRKSNQVVKVLDQVAEESACQKSSDGEEKSRKEASTNAGTFAEKGIFCDEKMTTNQAEDVTAKAGESNSDVPETVTSTLPSDATKVTKIPNCKTLRVNLKRHVFGKDLESENRNCKRKSPEKDSDFDRRKTYFVVESRYVPVDLECDNVKGKEVTSEDELNLGDAEDQVSLKSNSRKTFVKKKNDFSDDLNECPDKEIADVPDAELILKDKRKTFAVKSSHVLTDSQPSINLNVSPEKVTVNNELCAGVSDDEIGLKNNKRKTFVKKDINGLTDFQSTDLNSCPNKEIIDENIDAIDGMLVVLEKNEQITVAKNDSNGPIDSQFVTLNKSPDQEFDDEIGNILDEVFFLQNNKPKTVIENNDGLSDSQSSNLNSCSNKKVTDQSLDAPDDKLVLQNNEQITVARNDSNGSKSITVSRSPNKEVVGENVSILDDTFVFQINKPKAVTKNDTNGSKCITVSRSPVKEVVGENVSVLDETFVFQVNKPKTITKNDSNGLTDSKSTDLNSCSNKEVSIENIGAHDDILVLQNNEPVTVAKKDSNGSVDSKSITLNRSPDKEVAGESIKSVVCQDNEVIFDCQIVLPNRELNLVNLEPVSKTPERRCQSKKTSPSQCGINNAEINLAAVENSRTIEDALIIIPLGVQVSTETVPRNEVEEISENLKSLNFDVDKETSEDLKEDEESYIEFLNIIDMANKLNHGKNQKVFLESSESDCEVISDDEISFIEDTRSVTTTPIRKQISKSKKKKFVFDVNQKKNALKEKSISKIKHLGSPKNHPDDNQKKKKNVLQEKSVSKIKDPESPKKNQKPRKSILKEKSVFKIKDAESPKNANKKNQNRKKTISKEKPVRKIKNVESDSEKNTNKKKTVLKEKSVSKTKDNESNETHSEKDTEVCLSNGNGDISDNKTSADESDVKNKNAVHFSLDELDNKNCDKAQANSSKTRVKNPQISTEKVKSNKRNPPKDTVIDDLIPVQKKAKKRTKKKKDNVYFDDDSISKFNEDDARKVVKVKETAKNTEADLPCRKTGENTFLVRAEIHPLPSSLSVRDVEDLNKENVKINLQDVSVVLNDVLKSKNVNLLSSSDRDLLNSRSKTHPESPQKVPVNVVETTSSDAVLCTENIKSRRRKEVNYKEPSISRKMRRC